MPPKPLSRRGFLTAAGAASIGSAVALPPAKDKLHLATNEYPWGTFYGREKRSLADSLDTVLGEVAAAGLNGYEPLARSPEDVKRLAPLLQKHGLEMRSLYVNSTLHLQDKAAESIEQVLAIAEAARAAGTRIIVTNPSPLRWGGPENKDDTQIRFQAQALDKLGAALSAKGLTLAYHNHDMELRNAAREFHHMLVATDPKHVRFCLDAHWIFRGSGNSMVALFDVLELHGSRVVELHLRQSKDGIWTEVFGEGDIDYPALAARLRAMGRKPHCVLEQAVEKGSPNTMDALEAHRRGQEYARAVFAAFAG
jgi:inosose dehydratase